MEEKETIVKEIVGDIVFAAITIYLLNMLLADMFLRVIELGMAVFEKLD